MIVRVASFLPENAPRRPRWLHFQPVISHETTIDNRETTDKRRAGREQGQAKSQLRRRRWQLYYKKIQTFLLENRQLFDTQHCPFCRA
jgi:hypothetical protein